MVQPGERSIYERGCLRAGEEWVETNLVPVAGVAVGVAVLQSYDVAKIINERGCLQAGEEWLERNLLVVAGTAVGIAFFQLQCCGIEGPKDWDKNNYFNCSSRDVGSREACGVPFSCCKRKSNILGICFAQNLRADIFAQKAKWH
ncbi:hypothetical protein J437_LFUL012338 [Ladona fulva]|uniref:Uncharacterized protein n=1 Tax=Ladona fulva TaxID=123851 RepID=A0A8K0KH65_LADFU|nr:hypothetical protein J437_LFUL012338 [Ladona fulva]